VFFSTNATKPKTISFPHVSEEKTFSPPAFAIVAALLTVVHAHFRVLYPGPRGNFVANDEPRFCGGHTSVTTNRTTFPLHNGNFVIRTGHPNWSLGVYISTLSNASSFNDFSPELAKPFFRNADAGVYCLPIDVGATNVTGLVDGANVTLQFVFEGGDGLLYQCADLTLSSTATTVLPPNVTCSNVTATATPTSGAVPMADTKASVAGLLAIVGVALTFL